MLQLDHLAVAAETLEAGRDAVQDALSIALEPGGRHAHFATHNMLLGLEDGLYLEVIATDPASTKPDYPRWFDLDRFSGRPRPQVWVCRTDDLEQVVEALPQAGTPVALERGDLRWRMAVPANGTLPYDNCFPAVMKWDCLGHPSNRLTASGCRLRRLVVSHPEAAALVRQLEPHLADAPVVFEPGQAGLKAEFDTPSGPRVLE